MMISILCSPFSQDLRDKMVGYISLPIGEQHSEEKLHFPAACRGWPHQLDVSEGLPMLPLAQEGLNNSLVLP